MARLHVLSDCGDGLGLAYRLRRDGNDVTWWVRDVSARPMGKGLVEQSSNTAKRTVICDGVGLVTTATPRIGGNKLETWETKRGEGAQVMLEHGLAIPETVEFKRIAEAIRFLEHEGGEWYFKPDGDVPKSMTRKGDADWLLRFLAWARPQLSDVPRFILQRPVPDDPIEIDVGCWLNAQGPVAYEYCIEEKKLVTDIGPATGCQANVLWDARESDKLVGMTVGLFIDTLMESRYVGLVGVNCLITPKLETYGLEFTMRLGYDSTQAFMALFDDTLGDQLDEFARGTLTKFDRETKRAAMTLRLGCPPQPHEGSDDDKKWEGFPLPPNLLHETEFIPDDVALRDGYPVMATGSGFVGTYATTGTTLIGMRRHLLKQAKGAGVGDGMWQPEPVSRADAAIHFLRKHHLVHDPFEP